MSKEKYHDVNATIHTYEAYVSTKETIIEMDKQTSILPIVHNDSWQNCHIPPCAFSNLLRIMLNMKAQQYHRLHV